MTSYKHTTACPTVVHSVRILLKQNDCLDIYRLQTLLSYILPVKTMENMCKTEKELRRFIQNHSSYFQIENDHIKLSKDHIYSLDGNIKENLLKLIKDHVRLTKVNCKLQDVQNFLKPCVNAGLLESFHGNITQNNTSDHEYNSNYISLISHYSGDLTLCGDYIVPAKQKLPKIETLVNVTGQVSFVNNSFGFIRVSNNGKTEKVHFDTRFIPGGLLSKEIPHGSNVVLDAVPSPDYARNKWQAVFLEIIGNKYYQHGEYPCNKKKDGKTQNVCQTQAKTVSRNSSNEVCAQKATGLVQANTTEEASKITSCNQIPKISDPTRLVNPGFKLQKLDIFLDEDKTHNVGHKEITEVKKIEEIETKYQEEIKQIKEENLIHIDEIIADFEKRLKSTETEFELKMRDLKVKRDRMLEEQAKRHEGEVVQIKKEKDELSYRNNVLLEAATKAKESYKEIEDRNKRIQEKLDKSHRINSELRGKQIERETELNATWEKENKDLTIKCNTLELLATDLKEKLSKSHTACNEMKTKIEDVQKHNEIMHQYVEEIEKKLKDKETNIVCLTAEHEKKLEEAKIKCLKNVLKEQEVTEKLENELKEKHEKLLQAEDYKQELLQQLEASDGSMNVSDRVLFKISTSTQTSSTGPIMSSRMHHI